MDKPKVLILRFSSIGDIVLTTPVPRCLKTQLEAEVHYATKPEYRPILESNPYIDKIHMLDQGINRLIKNLKQEKFDYVIDLHNNLTTSLIKSRLKVTHHSFYKANIPKWLMVNFKYDNLPRQHIVDRYMETIKPLGVGHDRLGLDYFIPEKDEVENEWLPENFRNGYVVYAIGAKFNTKKLPVNRMIELCDRINKPIILLGGKEDQEKGEEVAKFFRRNPATAEYEPKLLELNKKAEVYNACGLFNLNQSASIIKNATHVFTHDTGMMHIAAAFKKYIFCIWGNTIPAFGMYPYKTQFTILENNHVNCRPCSKIGFKKCPKGHFKCMNDIIFDFYVK